MKYEYEAPEAVQYSYLPNYLGTDPLSGMNNGGEGGEGGNSYWDEP